MLGRTGFVVIIAWVSLIGSGTQTSMAATGVNSESTVYPKGYLQNQVDTAQANDVLRLAEGVYHGNLIIDKPLTLVGGGNATIQGEGFGRVVTVDAQDVTVSGLNIHGSGASLAEEDAAVFVTRNGSRAVVTQNHLSGNLIGIYLKGPKDAQVTHNTIEGRTDLRMNERGNGVHLWNTPGSRVERNTISGGRDGIFVSTSRDNAFLNNRLSELRFAVHYMYTNHSEVSDNYSENNHIGYAIMYSHHLKVQGNVSLGDRDRGLLLNYTNQSSLENNSVVKGKNSVAPQKCLFLYNANHNQLRGNEFSQCEIGIHFTAGSEGNVLSRNIFSDNRRQVKYVGTRLVEWSEQGQGNYWSDNTGFDLDGDGLADRPYQPNDLVDQLVWRYPMSRWLLNSPAIELLRWSQSQFPSFYPGGVMDSYPLMARPIIVKGGAS